MHSLPTSPVELNNRLIEAVCRGLPTGDYAEVEAVVSLNNILNGERPGRGTETRSGVNER